MIWCVMRLYPCADLQMKERCPALFTFLDMFGPPHIAIVPFVLLHFAFW